MALDFQEIVQDGMKLVSFGKKVASTIESVPADIPDRDFVVAKALSALLPEAIDLALEIKKDVKD